MLLKYLRDTLGETGMTLENDMGWEKKKDHIVNVIIFDRLVPLLLSPAVNRHSLTSINNIAVVNRGTNSQLYWGCRGTLYWNIFTWTRLYSDLTLNAAKVMNDLNRYWSKTVERKGIVFRAKEWNIKWLCKILKTAMQF